MPGIEDGAPLGAAHFEALMRRLEERRLWAYPHELDEEEEEAPTADSPIPTPDAAALLLKVTPMVRRLASCTNRAETAREESDEEAERALLRPRLSPKRRALLELMVPWVEQLAFSMSDNFANFFLTEHLSVGLTRGYGLRLLWKAVSSLSDDEVDAFLDDPRARVTFWTKVRRTMKELVIREGAMNGMMRFGVSVSVDFALFELPRDDGRAPGWAAYDRAAWGFAAAYLLGVYGAIQRLENQYAAAAMSMARGTYARVGAALEALAALDPEQAALLRVRARGKRVPELAKQLGVSEFEVGRRLHRALVALGELIREQAGGAGGGDVGPGGASVGGDNGGGRRELS